MTYTAFRWTTNGWEKYYRREDLDIVIRETKSWCAVYKTDIMVVVEGMDPPIPDSVIHYRHNYKEEK
jgi:hypothetical protein